VGFDVPHASINLSTNAWFFFIWLLTGIYDCVKVYTTVAGEYIEIGAFCKPDLTLTTVKINKDLAAFADRIRPVCTAEKEGDGVGDVSLAYFKIVE